MGRHRSVERRSRTPMRIPRRHLDSSRRRRRNILKSSGKSKSRFEFISLKISKLSGNSKPRFGFILRKVFEQFEISTIDSGSSRNSSNNYRNKDQTSQNSSIQQYGRESQYIWIFSSSVYFFY
mgnify:CR=1 FL=1